MLIKKIHFCFFVRNRKRTLDDDDDDEDDGDDDDHHGELHRFLGSIHL